MRLTIHTTVELAKKVLGFLMRQHHKRPRIPCAVCHKSFTRVGSGTEKDKYRPYKHNCRIEATANGLANTTNLVPSLECEKCHAKVTMTQNGLCGVCLDSRSFHDPLLQGELRVEKVTK